MVCGKASGVIIALMRFEVSEYDRGEGRGRLGGLDEVGAGQAPPSRCAATEGRERCGRESEIRARARGERNERGVAYSVRS